MKMRFTRKAEYDDLRGGVINYGQGLMFNVGTDLPEDGVFETEDPRLQHVLAEYRGDQGRVFDTVIVMPDGTEREAELEEAPAKPPLRTPAEAIAQQVESGAVTQHAAAEGYALLAEDELKDILHAKNVQFPPSATKDELVQLIEADDRAKGV